MKAVFDLHDCKKYRVSPFFTTRRGLRAQSRVWHCFDDDSLHELMNLKLTYIRRAGFSLLLFHLPMAFNIKLHVPSLLKSWLYQSYLSSIS